MLTQCLAHQRSFNKCKHLKHKYKIYKVKSNETRGNVYIYNYNRVLLFLVCGRSRQKINKETRASENHFTPNTWIISFYHNRLTQNLKCTWENLNGRHWLIWINKFCWYFRSEIIQSVFFDSNETNWVEIKQNTQRALAGSKSSE